MKRKDITPTASALAAANKRIAELEGDVEHRRRELEQRNATIRRLQALARVEQQAPANDWDATVADFIVWARATFPGERMLPAARHLCREAAEVLRAVENRDAPEAIAEECADTIMLALNVADRIGADPLVAFREKLTKNKTRTWAAPDAVGIIEHEREQQAPADPPDALYKTAPDLDGMAGAMLKTPVAESVDADEQQAPAQLVPRAELDAAVAQVAVLVEALTAALKRCKCHGTGRYYPHCYKCDDSGEDHNDCPEERDCETCAPARDALASTPERARRMAEGIAALRRIYLHSWVRDPDGRPRCLICGGRSDELGHLRHSYEDCVGAIAEEAIAALDAPASAKEPDHG